ncbi:hypothetical protein GCM10011519_15630 [Marmoricola endophyticus]|uniref:Glycosyltransferase 2-like domain-containing protein n=1 Tax=Marmoricola endophyticus TaxID=2040280 RepID=A0A917BG30_9ACTN|nr:glycosyltransferase [Marmoricola endophyticus]GGF42626.1 hypothetical protein GCM10011519_15630 [Marmoricola endophyticus]
MSAGDRARRLAGRVARRLRPDGDHPAEQQPAQQPDGPAPWERVRDSGLFDRAYYEIQTGTAFPDEGAAVRHYLRRGGPVGLAPHPLFEPEWFRPEGWRERPDALLGYLDGQAGDPSPWIDEAAYVAAHPEAAAHPGRAMGHFLEHASDTTPVPAPYLHQQLPLAEVRSRMAAIAEEGQRFRAARTARPRGPWDESADGAFLAQWAEGDPVPPGADGAPAVTVVMPVRNRPEQVREAIASVQAQQHRDWELLVVDDGSTDDTADVVEAYDDPRVQVLRREHGGVSAARNAGIEAARGRWLAFLDSDNTWEPLFLQVMLRYLEAEGRRAGYCVVDQGETEDEASRYLCLDAGLDHLLVRNHIDLNSLVVATEVARAAGGFDTTMRRWVDHDFAIGLARQVEIGLVPFVGVRYDHSEDAADRITTSEADYWQWFALSNSHLDWDAQRRGLPERRAGLVSVCIATFEDWAMTTAAVESVLAAADLVPEGAPGADVEVVVLDNGSRRGVAGVLGSRFAGEDRVRVRTVPCNLNLAIGADVAFHESRGEHVVFLDNDTQVHPGWLPPLLAALEDPDVLGAQPLLVHPDGTVQSAGLVFTGAQEPPETLLAGRPGADARRLGSYPLHAVSASALAVRASDVVDLKGFDVRFVNGLEDSDLCLRAVDGGERRFRVVTEASVTHLGRGTEGRRDRVEGNLRLWHERWAGRVPFSELGLLDDLGS